MKNLKASKTFAAIITAATLAMSLTACGSSAPAASTEAASTEVSTEAASSEVSEAPASTEEVSEAPAASTEAAPSEAPASEAPASTEAASSEAPVVEEDETNTDITAGTTDDAGNYTCSAVLGGGTVDASVDALGSSIVTSDFSKATAIGDKGSVALKDARLAYLTVQNDGDKDAAKEDLEDYDASAPSSAMLTEIKKYSEDLGKLYAQFGVEAYDLSAPYDSDTDYVTYDVFTKDGKNSFLVDFNFENGSLISIDFSQE
ncbi:MAG: hypothetical protein K6G84_02810 [Lachnospiraceae bacterium]|nr:hypothetical protein [Lachnospiraceae bacterium]